VRINVNVILAPNPPQAQAARNVIGLTALTNFELVVNRKTAKALGIKIPQSILLRGQGDRVIARRVLLALCSICLLAAPLAADAPQAGKVLPWDPAPHKVILELQQALAHAIERFQAMDEAGVLSHVSDRYRTDPLTKAAIREQLRVMFALYDTLRAQVRIDEARTAGEQAWVYSTGEVSGRLRWLGTWTPILSWQHEPEVAQREQGVWRLYGYQQ